MDTKNKILDIAQRLIQERGVNGFSYADVAKELGVAKASLHHHFATKADLVSHLTDRYTNDLKGHLLNVQAAGQSPEQQLIEYFKVYKGARSLNLVCLGGILSAESAALSTSMHSKLKSFFDLQCHWLAQVLTAGINNGVFTVHMTPERQARSIITSLQGALMVSQTAESDDYFNDSVSAILSSLTNSAVDVDSIWA